MRTAALLLALCVSLDAAAEDKAPVVPLLQGSAAPHSGLLVSEERFKMYLDQQLKLEEAEAKAELRERAWKEAEQRAARGWFEQYGFIIGLTVGVVAGGAAVWKISELTKVKP